MRLSANRGVGSATLSLALALLSALAWPQSLVLCIAAGGHVAIETAFEVAPCIPPLERDGDAMASPSSESCVDTPLVQWALESGSDTSADTPPLAVVRTLDSGFPSVVRFPRNALGSRAPRAAERRAHRSIVLIV